MKENIIRKYITIANIIFFTFLISCNKKSICVYDKINNEEAKIVYSKNEIKLEILHNLKGQITLLKKSKSGYIISSQNLMVLPKIASIKDSILFSTKEFYDSVLIKDTELNNEIFYSSYNFKISDDLFVRKISFSPSPIYCLKIYYDSNFYIKRIYFKYGDKNMTFNVENKAISKDVRYINFLSRVTKDSLFNIESLNYIEEY